MRTHKVWNPCNQVPEAKNWSNQEVTFTQLTFPVRKILCRCWEKKLQILGSWTIYFYTSRGKRENLLKLLFSLHSENVQLDWICTLGFPHKFRFYSSLHCSIKKWNGTWFPQILITKIGPTRKTLLVTHRINHNE